MAIETDRLVGDVEALADEVHSIANIAAPISSGSFRVDGMIVVSFSVKTLSAIVHSFSDNLLTRAADVTLKEGRPVALLPRETPLHVGHCKLLHEAAQMGIHIAPPMPAFYNKPQTIDDLIDHAVGRVLDLFGVEAGLVDRWKGPPRFAIGLALGVVVTLAVVGVISLFDDDTVDSLSTQVGSDQAPEVSERSDRAEVRQLLEDALAATLGDDQAGAAETDRVFRLTEAGWGPA